MTICCLCRFVHAVQYRTDWLAEAAFNCALTEQAQAFKPLCLLKLARFTNGPAREKGDFQSCGIFIALEEPIH
jgi:hypothetical protein